MLRQCLSCLTTIPQKNAQLSICLSTTCLSLSISRDLSSIESEREIRQNGERQTSRSTLSSAYTHINICVNCLRTPLFSLLTRLRKSSRKFYFMQSFVEVELSELKALLRFVRISLNNFLSRSYAHNGYRPPSTCRKLLHC